MTGTSNGEGQIRANIVEGDLVAAMVTLPTQLFRSTGIPVCLWFFAKDKAKRPGARWTGVDRCSSSTRVSSASWLTDGRRSLADSDIARITDTFHAWRGTSSAKDKRLSYADVPGFCASVTLAQIKESGIRPVARPLRRGGGDGGDGPIEAKIERLTAEFAHFGESARLETIVRDPVGTPSCLGSGP